MFIMFVWISFVFFISSEAWLIPSEKIADSMTAVESNELIKDIVYEGLVLYEKAGVIHPLFEYVISQLVSNVEEQEKYQRPARMKFYSLPPPKNYLKSLGVTSRTLHRILKKYGMCAGCAAIAQYIIVRALVGFNRNALLKILISLCTVLRIEPKHVCVGAIEPNIDIFLYIAKHRKNLIVEEVCSILLQNFKCFPDFRSQWSVYIPYGYSPQRFDDDREPSNTTLRVLQLTDIHIDPMYEPGANAVCAEKLCCDKNGGSPIIAKNGAGKWGDYRYCDMPYYLLADTLNQIMKQHRKSEISYVYFTGDIIDHRIWATNIPANRRIIEMTYDLFKKVLGSIPIYPLIGNHEPHPVNVFTPHSVTDKKLSMLWLFEDAVKIWSHWLPEETHATIRQGGFYTVLVKPGFRIIALNSNVCYIYNWWLLYDNRDPYNQLQWFSHTLSQAEAKNESVHILSHVPPGDNTCLQEWTRQYHKIVERFANTITGQFNGHTHFVEWRVFYNSSDYRDPVNVAYNGGSFTSYHNLNPNYRFYDIDSETYEVVDYQDWTYNVTKANMNATKSPEWYQIHSFKEDFQMKSLRPKDFDDLISRMADNSSIVEEYYRYKIRDADPAMKKGCNGPCIIENWCSLSITQVGITDYAKCVEFL